MVRTFLTIGVAVDCIGLGVLILALAAFGFGAAQLVARSRPRSPIHTWGAVRTSTAGLQEKIAEYYNRSW
jgi:hypothetical protein